MKTMPRREKKRGRDLVVFSDQPRLKDRVEKRTTDA